MTESELAELDGAARKVAEGTGKDDPWLHINPQPILSLIAAHRKALADIAKAQNVAVDIAMKLAKAKAALEFYAHYPRAHEIDPRCHIEDRARAALKEIGE